MGTRGECEWCRVSVWHFDGRNGGGTLDKGDLGWVWTRVCASLSVKDDFVGRVGAPFLSESGRVEGGARMPSTRTT
jgi:hypothetical protein